MVRLNAADTHRGTSPLVQGLPEIAPPPATQEATDTFEPESDPLLQFVSKQVPFLPGYLGKAGPPHTDIPSRARPTDASQGGLVLHIEIPRPVRPT